MVKILYIVFCSVAVICAQQIMAQVPAADLQQGTVKRGKMVAADKNSDTTSNDAASVSTVLTTPNKNAFYDSRASYTFEVKNPTDDEQEGTVSYQVYTEGGKKLNSDVVKVHIGKKSSGSYNFEIPEQNPGFYKVSFMVNVSDYDDTTLRVFGIRPGEIRTSHPKPADFDQFWATAKAELAKVAPNFKITAVPKMNSDNRKVYAIEMQSLDKYTIHGRMTIPIIKDKKHKFSVLLGLPGYQVDMAPLMGLDNDLAIITLDVRGQGKSRNPINTRKDEYIFFRVEDKDRYVMRGAIMDCLRCVDFICSQPYLKHDQILASGGSMGGYLALATASLDKRVALCSAQNPILCDIRNLPGEVLWPITSFEKYVATKPGLTMDKVMDNLDYFDGKNFASNLTCNMIMGIGLLDPYAPPNNEYAAFNGITSKKRILVFRDLGHEVSLVYKNLEGRWMRDNFALF